MKIRFDYPEYLFQSWQTFEHQHGTIAEIEAADAEVRKQMKGLNAKRARLVRSIDFSRWDSSHALNRQLKQHSSNPNNSKQVPLKQQKRFKPMALQSNKQMLKQSHHSKDQQKTQFPNRVQRRQTAKRSKQHTNRLPSSSEIERIRPC
jgi:hypothetical protein